MARVEIYLNFICEGGVVLDGDRSRALVIVPKERKAQFLEQFPGSSIERGKSEISIDQITAAALARQKVIEGGIADISATADILQMSRARLGIEQALSLYTDEGSQSPFSKDVIAFLESRDSWQADDFVPHWANKGVGGFKDFYFGELYHQKDNFHNIRTYRRVDHNMEQVDMTEEVLGRQGEPCAANEYQYQRYLDTKNDLYKRGIDVRLNIPTPSVL